MNNKHFLWLTLISLLGLNSCVNNNYDLSNIDTDKIVIGDHITASLGNGILTLDKILDVESIKEISTDVDGNYIASYSDELIIEMPRDIRLKEIDLTALKVNLPLDMIPSNFPLPHDISIKLENEESAIELNATEEITQIDSVLFDVDDGKSMLNIALKINDLNVSTYQSKVNFTLIFPNEYKLKPYGLSSEEYTWDQNKLQISFSVKDLEEEIILSFKVIQAKINLSDVITYETSFNFCKGDVVSVGANPQLIIKGSSKELTFKTIYGSFDMDLLMDQSSINMGDISKIFEGENNDLSFTNPYIKLITNSNIGIPIIAQLNLKATNDKHSLTTQIDEIEVTPSIMPGLEAANNIWIGLNEPSNVEEFLFIKNNDLSKLIKIVPNNLFIDISANTATGEGQFLTSEAKANIKYTVEIPFTPAIDFVVNITEEIKDVFDKDMVNYLFSGGTATIYGEILNLIPLDMTMNMVIVDKNNVPIDIQLAPQQVKGCADNQTVSSTVSFDITEDDMPKMKQAKNINLELKLSSTEALAGKALNKNQTLAMKFKIKKTGGIMIDNSDKN